MSLPNLSRLDTALLYPAFLDRLSAALSACNDAGADYVATLGFRTWSEQARIYFQGRTTPGPIVTHAPPGFSSHNYGLAVDVCRMFDGNVVSWDPQDYELLGEEAEKVGLVWGGRWTNPDRPHVQWPGYVTEAELMPLKHLWQLATAKTEAEQLATVWCEVTSTHGTFPDFPMFTPPPKEPV